jgi:NADH dehydrogenase FAD-containing subunit
MGYDWLVLVAGSVNKLLPIPGVGEHAHGFRGISGSGRASGIAHVRTSSDFSSRQRESRRVLLSSALRSQPTYHDRLRTLLRP